MTGKNNRVKSTNDIELKDRLVAINRVTKVTKGGRTFSFSAIVVVGNEAGIVGWGLGKASEVTTAIAKGVEAAKKNLVKVPVLKGTIPHDQLAKFGGALVYIKPASPGTGVKCGYYRRACEVERFVQSSQFSEGYDRCIVRIERCCYSRSKQRYLC